jgi:predicted nuclease with TOPRIM domain
MSKEWKSFEEEPDDNRYIHLFKNNDFPEIMFYTKPWNIKEWIRTEIMFYTKSSRWNIKEWIRKGYKWCYVFMPDPPKEEKIIIGSGVINLNAELSKINSRLDSMEDQIKKLKSDDLCLATSFDRINNDTFSRLNSIQDRTKDLEILNIDLSRLSGTLDSIEDVIKDLEKDNNFLESSMDRFHAELFDSQQEYLKLSEKVEYLEWKLKLKENK